MSDSTNFWWHQPFRTFQTNLREIDAGLDVESVLDTIENYGADTWLLSVGGIIANYPSDLDCQTVNPVLAQRDSEDLVGDAVNSAKARGIRVLGRMDFSKIDALRAEEHPEWCFVSASGELQIYNGYRSVCPSGEYYQRHMFDVIEEVLSRYDIAGFFFNWMSFNERDYSRAYWGVCHCEPCLAGFRRFAPRVEHPTGPESVGYGVWKEFSNGVLDDLHRRMRLHIKRIQPNVGLILGDRADITFHEANNAVGRPLWHFLTAEQVSAARTVDPYRPVFVNAVGFVDMPYRWAGEDPNHFAQYLVQAIAHGAQPSTYIMGTPEDSRFSALEAGSRITRFHGDHERIYRRYRSTSSTAVVRGSSGTETEHENHRAEFQGVYASLVEKHVPFDVLRIEALEEVDLTRYKLLILPDVGSLSEPQAQHLQSALESGASVILTGSSAWDRGSLQLATDGPLATQRARFTTEEALRSLHVPVNEAGDFAPVLGSFAVLEPNPAEELETGWHALGRSLYGPPEKCYGHVQTAHPGWVAGYRGKGRLGILPWLPGLVYSELGLSRVRDAWVQRVLSIAPWGLQVRGSVPEQVQVVLGESSEGTVIHLLNRSGDAPQRFRKPMKTGPFTLSLPYVGQPAKVRAWAAKQDIPWQVSGEELILHVQSIDLFEVITITSADSSTSNVDRQF